jgi:membrane protein DedA with SNARE-associated domain
MNDQLAGLPGYAVHLLLTYRYAVLFPLTVIEGPVITFIAGILSSAGIFSFIIAYGVVVAGDLTGDSIYYLFGRFSANPVSVWFKSVLNVSDSTISKLKQKFQKQSTKTMILGKATEGIGAPILWAAGAAEIPYSKFILVNGIATIIKSFLIMLGGYYFGYLFHRFKTLLDILAAAALVITGASFFWFVSWIKKQ